MSDEAWEVFAKMCKTVCENENVYVQAFIVKDLALIQLLPLEEE